MTAGRDWIVAIGSEPEADPRWCFTSLTNVPAALKKDPKYWGHRAVVNVSCPTCGQLVSRVDVSAQGQQEPVYVAWSRGGLVTRPLPGRDRYPESFFVGFFPLIRDGERAPDELRFLGECSEHGLVEVDAARLWLAMEAKGRKPKRIAATIRQENTASR